MAISGGVREPMFSPIGRCTRAMSAGRDAEGPERRDVRARVMRVAEDADPAGLGGESVAQHHA